MVVNNQQMEMGEDRPVNINEMDFEFLTKETLLLTYKMLRVGCQKI